MEIAALIILILCCVTGFLAIFFTTFGTLIIFSSSVLYAFMTGFSIITVRTLIVLFLLYMTGEAFEYLMVIFGAKHFGASNVAVAGAVAGGVAGSVAGAVFFGVGIIAGAFLGVFFGAFIGELIVKRDLIQSFRSGAGGVVGRIGSVIAKVVLAGIMFAVMVRSIL